MQLERKRTATGAGSRKVREALCQAEGLGLYSETIGKGLQVGGRLKDFDQKRDTNRSVLELYVELS